MNEASETETPLVLVVDDDRSMRMVLHEALAAAGFEVIEAANGQAAIELYLDRNPDVVLLDIVMPGMDGYEVCRRIRSLIDARSIPILMMTGRDDIGSIDASYDAGATDFVPKPVPYSLLPYRLRYLLRISQAIRRERESVGRLARAQRSARLVQWEHMLSDGSFRWSEEVHEVFGIERGDPREGVIALLRWVHPDDRQAVEAALASFVPHRLDYRMVLPDGRERIVHHEAEWADDVSLLTPHLVGAVQDMTERWMAERNAAQLAYYDALTGLPNRNYLRNYLTRIISTHEREGTSFAVLALELDGLSRVNDMHGHGLGDKVVLEVAERLRACLEMPYAIPNAGFGPTPVETQPLGPILARVAGSEFSIVLPGPLVDDGALMAQRILERLSLVYSLQNSELAVSTSIGIAVYPDGGCNAEELLQHAGAAMHHARETGRNHFRVFVHAMKAKVLRRMQIERGLRHALGSTSQRPGASVTELALHFQPRIELPSYTTKGVEALLRWNSRELGSVSPAEFIPVAEESGVIVPLGQWVLRSACATMQRLMPGLDLSVNISPRQFSEPGFVATVAEVLRSTGYPPERLELEITEGVVMQGTQETHGVMEQLKQLGVRIVLDDFGTGYSSLSYLVSFPIDTLKIDRSFVVGLPAQKNASVIAAILALARGLELQVVVEGVETEAQLQHFVPFGRIEIQGYHFSRPRPAEELVGWLAENPRRPI
jgi:predicted signal transduction protein with EAL and GGDEF domain/DNA-binding NarL/FixJ family response regulator